MISIEKWAGLVTNASPYSIPPGAAVTQVNLQAVSPGQLTVRPGLQAVTFASTAIATQPVISAFNYQRSVGGGLVYQDAAGAVYSTQVPSGGLPPSFSGVPGTPRNLTASAGSGSATLDWDEPEFSGGGGVTAYSVQRSSDGGSTWTFAASSPETSASLTGLTNGTTYVFRVASTNAYGIGNYTAASNSVTPVGAPGSPTSLTASPGNAEAVLSWAAPSSNGGSAITDYVVQYSGDGGGTWTTFSDGTSTATTATVTGLANGSPYVFRVAARNIIADSEFIAWMTPILPLGVPGQVSSLSAAHGNQQASLLWSAPPANHAGGITDYVIQQSTDGGSTWTTITDGASADTSLTVTGLTNGSSYRYRVAAVNAVGVGPYSSATAAVIPRTTPNAPTSLTGVAGNAQVELSWSAPVVTGGAAITDYQIEVSVSSGPYSVITRSASTATTYTATGLTNGSSYRYRVAAVNSEGPGATVTSSALVPQTVPLAPTSVTGTSGDGLSLVRWTAPTDNGGSAVIDYVIQYSSDSGSTWATFSDGSSTNTQTTVTGLTNGTAYLFRVAAVSSVGTGNYSTASAAVTPVGAPTAPTGASATGGNRQITAAWTAPSNNGGAAITGYVIQYKQTSASTWSTYGTVPDSPAVIAGLVNGAEYVVRVAAVNNRNFTGPYSTQSNAVYPGRVAVAPTSLSITSRTATAEFANSISLQWTIGATYGSTVTGHSVQYQETGTTAWIDATGPTSANTCTITDQLSSAKSYNFRVATITTVGPSPYSSTLANQAVSVAPTGLTLTSAVSAGYVTVTWAVSNAGTGVLASAGLEDGIEFANVATDLSAKTVTFPTGAAGARTLTVRVGNFAGSLTASTTVTAQAGTVTTAPTFLTPTFDEGRIIQDIILPTVGVDHSDSLLLEVSTNSGSTWSTVGEHTGVLHPTTMKYKRSSLLLPTPSSTLYHPDHKWGLARYYISKPPSVSFLLRASASTAGGTAVSGTPASVTASLTAPGTYADSAWGRVAFLYDTQSRKSIVRERSGLLTTSLISSSSPQPTGTGRFGDAYVTQDTPYIYRSFSTAGAASTARGRYDYGSDDVLTCEAWVRATLGAGSSDRYLFGVQRTGNNVQGVSINSTSFKYTPVVNENQRGTSNPEHGHVYVDAQLLPTAGTTTPYRLIVRAYTNEFAGANCVTNQSDYIRRDFTISDDAIDQWVHLAVEFSQKKLFYTADNTLRVYLNGRALTAVSTYSSWNGNIPAGDRVVRNSSSTWPCATHGCTNGANCPFYDNLYFSGSRGIAWTSEPRVAGNIPYFMPPNSLQYLETLRVTAGGRYFGEFTPPERAFAEPT
jgi:hypothetical protein